MTTAKEKNQQTKKKTFVENETTCESQQENYQTNCTTATKPRT